MTRWASVLLALLLANVVAAQGLDTSPRPATRDTVPVVRPSARPYDRPILAHGVQTRPWYRAELGMYARPAEDFVLPVQPVPDVRPRARGTVEAKSNIPAVRPIVRPYLRPDLAFSARTHPLFRAEIGLFAYSPTAIAMSPFPQVRPAAIEAAAEARRVARLRGQVCGDPSIQGDAIGRVEGPGACGVSDAVRVRSVAGVTLQPRATMDCRTAAALKTWVENGAQAAVASEGGGVASLRVVSHYACRNRNNAANGRLSEHANGRAIDIAGIQLRNGREITVLSDWGNGSDGARLRQMWRAACGPFGTVLGPEANRFHLDHFHFDTARYRSGSYCR